MLFGEKITEYWDDIVKDLAAVVAVPSVAKPQDGEHPFGDECARVLDTALALAQSYGLKTKNVDYYAGHAEYGEGEENAVVMAHLDVVPAGDKADWNTDPFTLVIDGTKAYGRGVGDDKGAAIVALHCLRALKDAGVQGKRKLRVVFGCAEEIGMQDMGYYFSKEQHPDLGFTPDSGYGICHCEKGIINFNVFAKNDSIVKTFNSGTVSNAVPAKAECELICTDEEFAALEKAAAEAPLEIKVEKTADGAKLLSIGKASHAAFPQGGVNAASHLIKVLGEVFGDKVGAFFKFINEKIGLTSDGSLLGIDMEDEPSGPLTFNLGLVHANADDCDLTVDIRYPATKSGKDIVAKIKEGVDPYGITFSLISDAEPLYLPKESKLVTLLKGAYEDIMGEECVIYSMGGGTYARQMFGKGVGFGPGFMNKGDVGGNAHDVNEYVDLEYLKMHAKICLEAMYRLLTCD